MKKPLRIIFMGTPEFAVSSLNTLIENNYMVVAVVTSPDKPAGRGYNVSSSAVKKYALEKNLKVLQPQNLKAIDFINELKELHADLQIVVAFRMLPEVVWAMPPLGTFNLHASLLPQYRGAAPINWAIINGEKETGVTTFFLQQEIDTGDIILQTKIPIEENENAGELHDKLKLAGAKLVIETVKKIEEGDMAPIKQELISKTKKLNVAPKIFKKDCEINWQNKAIDIHNKIRGLSPFPGSFTLLKDKSTLVVSQLKIFKSFFSNNTKEENIAEIITDNKTYLHVNTSYGYIIIEELQLEGKKRLPIGEFLKGIDLSKYIIVQSYEK